MPYANVPKSLWGKMDRCVEKVMATGKDKPRAIAICYAALVEKKSLDDLAVMLAPEGASRAAQIASFGGAVKSLGETPEGGLRLGGYLVNFGTPEQHDATSYKDYFDAQTDFGDARETDIWYHHRLPLKTRDGGEITVKRRIGKGKLSADEHGILIEAITFNRDEYDRMLNRAIKATLDKHGWSSGTASHLVEREDAPNGAHHIKVWPLGLDASLTPTPAEPRGLVELKSAGGEAVAPDGLEAIKAFALPNAEHKLFSIALSGFTDAQYEAVIAAIHLFDAHNTQTRKSIKK
jgi:hypothetical protein